MPKFLVRLGCYRYESNPMIVEADDVESAIKKAIVEDDGEYEPGDLGPSWAEEVEDENGISFDVPERHKEPINYVLSGAERDMILAALRLMQREIEFGYVGPDLEDIATNGDEHPALTLDEIDALSERLNT